MIITSRTLRALGFATCVAVTASSLAACGGHKGKATVETTSSSPAPVSTSASTTATPPPVADVNPLTGGKPNNNPVIAVKIDDASVAIPQVGIDQADIVYVEQVEGGLTRLIAVYNSKKPETVGPVRSVRSNDPQLLNQYGPIAIVASGGGGDSLPTLDGSILKSDINDRGGPGFFRDGSRVAPHNLMFSLAANPGHWTAKAKSIGFVWDASTASLKGTPAGAALHTIVGASSVDFTYNARYQEYIRVIGGVQQKAADGN